MTEATDAATVLVVDDDVQVRTLIARLLTRAGYNCVEAADGEAGLVRALEVEPDLILLDVAMPGMSGSEVLDGLRTHFRTRFTPVIYVTGNTIAEVAHLLAGADDYVTKPFKPDELIARVQVALRRARTLRNLNPLTGLPGNELIIAEAQSRLEANEDFAYLYVDLDFFKSFNDTYGFARGDDVLRLLHDVIVEAVRACASPRTFVGHIGGDDFVVMTEPALLERLGYEIIMRLEKGVGALDPRPADRRVSVSIGAVAALPGRFPSARELAEAAARMKSSAKKVRRSHLAIDDRAVRAISAPS